MDISRSEKGWLIKELSAELNAKPDGSGKNLIVPTCPYCGKSGGKFGIYIGKEIGSKKLFMSHCFKCGKTVRDINQLLVDIGRPDLQLTDTVSFEPLTQQDLLFSLEEEEIDDSLSPVEMPEGWKSCHRSPYLKQRGFKSDDYDYFPVGTTRGLNFKFDDYVVFPIIDNGITVGYIGRHTWDKDRIDSYNLSPKLS